MRAALNLAGFGCVALFCVVACGQSSIDSALSEYNKKKAEIIKPVLDAYDAEIKAAQEKGDLLKAKQILVEKEAFIRREESDEKLALDDAIREFQKRVIDSKGLLSSVQRSKSISENIDWLDKNLSRQQIKLEFRILDVRRAGNGTFHVVIGDCETSLGRFVELRNPEFFVVKMTDKQAEEIGIDHRLVVSGTPEIGRIAEASYPVFYIDAIRAFGNSGLDLAIYMKNPTVKLIEK